MGKRGPRPTPTAKLKLSGSWRAGRNRREPQPERALPSCPTWLPREAKAEWKRVASELVAMGLITRADRALFTAYCETWARYVQAVKQVEKEGLTAVTDKGNVIQHPAVGVANKQKAELRRLAQEFGLSPSSRTRIEVPKQEDQVSGKARFFPTVG